MLVDSLTCIVEQRRTTYSVPFRAFDLPCLKLSLPHLPAKRDGPFLRSCRVDAIDVRVVDRTTPRALEPSFLRRAHPSVHERLVLWKQLCISRLEIRRTFLYYCILCRRLLNSIKWVSTSRSGSSTELRHLEDRGDPVFLSCSSPRGKCFLSAYIPSQTFSSRYNLPSPSLLPSSVS